MASETVSALREHVYPRAVVNWRPDFVPEAVIGASGGLVLRFARDDDAAAIIALISAVWSGLLTKVSTNSREAQRCCWRAASTRTTSRSAWWASAQSA